ncbi:MAG: CBS domain-containing protein [Nitrospirota bacterium]
MDLITSHINADFDAFAGMVAAKKLYPQAEAVFSGSQEKKLRDFLESFSIIPIRRLKDIDVGQVRKLIVVDSKSPDRLGPLAELLSRPGVEVHVYDHHAHAEGDIHGTVEVVEQVGSTATIFTEILERKALKPTPMEATALCLGIYEETGNMLFPGTTERDMKAAAYLLRCGASLKIVSAYMKTDLNVDELQLLTELTRSATELALGGLSILVAKASLQRYLGDAAHLAHRLMDIEYTDAVVLILSMEGKIVVVGRSRAPELNIARVMEALDGGGHPTAASATLKEMPLEILEEKIVGLLRKAVKPGKFAEDVMTSPVITVEAAKTIKEAESLMTIHGVNVLPVVSGQQYLGIISRESVEKALYHGLAESTVLEFATTDALTAERYTPIRQVETRMIEHNQRFMPVVEDGGIVGAITRTDILRTLYEEYLRRRGVKKPLAGERAGPKKNIASWLKNRYPGDIYTLLRIAGEIAGSLGYNAYLVGGSVRDLLRGEENLDLDIVIEGNGIDFARHLAVRLGGRVRAHERFGTAKVITEGLKLDVATARTEYYETPAALPKVQVSSIKKDLYRRDFTINTLAVKLNPGSFGEMVDFFGGQRDLKERTIRVLHNLSFVEDPTRAFRAVRFAERFGFKLSKHIENLIRSAVRMNLFERLSGKRLHEELSLIFREKEPVPVIRGLAEHGLLTVIHPSLELTDKLQELLTQVHHTLTWFTLSFPEERCDRALLYLTALLTGLTDEEREKALERLAVPSRVGAAVDRNIRDAREALRVLPLKDPADIHNALSQASPEGLLLAMSMTTSEEKRKEMSTYLLRWRKVKPILRGNDLKRMGIETGPIYAEILKKLLEERLRGRLLSREDEEGFVRRYVRSAGLRS